MYLSDKAVGQKIQTLLRDTSQRELADAVGMHPSQVTRSLRGERRLDLSEIVAIAEFLGVEPGNLIDDEQPVFAMRTDAGNEAAVDRAVEDCTDLIEDFLTYRALAGR